MKRMILTAALALMTLSIAAPALAHGDISETAPGADTKVKGVPGVVEATFTEPPTKDSVFQVLDGCGKDVSGHVTVEGSRTVAHITGAQPGQWDVSYRVISSVDGHLSQGSYGFTVDGKKDCSKTAKGDGKSDGGDAGDAGDVQAQAPDPQPANDEGGGLPLVPIAIGTVALIGVAAAVRVLASR